MHPSLIDFGQVHLPILGDVHLALPTYGLLFAAGALVAWQWFMRRARSIGVPDETAFNLCFYGILAGLLGAKVALIAVDLRLYLENPALLLGTIRAAGVLMGGVIAGAAVFVLYGRRHGLPMLRIADAVVAPVALAQAIGRLGCFAAGCCYGVPVDPDNPIAVTFTDPAAAAQTGVPLHVPLAPTQLFQFANDLALAVVLTVLWRKDLRPGTTVSAYLVLYGLGRGVIELWRGDAQRGLFFGGVVSTSQALSVVSIAIGVVLFVRFRGRDAGTSA
jgi:phosphatidylglycerol:prolipoprotein diacylglycerol transferase